ncbi:unnamed protein product [Onchocerca flexuosa]|uniref:Uncharacterized protein n=1 Tax=Onchocerca flexuosa TaxID=387005 RepID=A0A183HZT1_9BILA|nr:unnamed protein product [Onchocerca flexuosa]
MNMAMSLSSPVMIVTYMIKRGRCNYVAMYGNESENLGNGNRVEKDLVELNKQLNYNTNMKRHPLDFIGGYR